MLPEQMADEARKAIETGTNMTLTRRRGSKRLPGFPRGELLCENHNGRNVYSYNPKRVLAWLQKNGLIAEDETGDEE